MEQDKLFNAIRNIVKKILSKTKFNYCVQGKVTQNNGDGSYQVLINDGTSKVKRMNSNTYVVGDIVWVMIINNNYSDKYILTKC
jgi:hypothetical protein